MRLHRGLLLPTLLAAPAALCGTAFAKKDGPSLTRKEFRSEPLNLLYFDDSETLLLIEKDQDQIWRSPDSGETWEEVDDIPSDKKPQAIFHNPWDNNVAVALGAKKTHWITYDQGKKWTAFESEEHPSPMVQPVSFHAGDNKKILFHGIERGFIRTFIGKTWYTDDGFKSDMKLARDHRKMCLWAKSADLFTSDDKDIDANRILCVVEGKYRSTKMSDYRLVRSDNYFEDEDEVTVEGQNMKGFANLASVKGFMVAAALGHGDNELALYTTTNTKDWHKAEFGEHRLEEDAYTVLESTDYSIQVDVMTSTWRSEGALFSSNSDGHYFTKHIEHTNRDDDGFVDFERLSAVQGVIMVNLVDNWKDLASFVFKKIKSKISFDDGRTFEDLKAGKETLHVHSVTELKNSGRVFSSPAPGIVMAVGNTGEHLKKYDDGDLYVSNDGGLNWELALENAHKFEFGDKGAVLVATYDEGETDEIRFSFKHGKDGKDKWGTAKLENKLRVVELTTIPDSTSLRFILVGYEGGGGRNEKWVTYGINFEDVHERDCKEDDFEMWHARANKDGEGTCVMGRTQSFRRRKADSECLVKEEFKDPVPKFETCDCSDADYECDTGFEPKFENGKKVACEPTSPIKPPKDACKDGDDKFMGPSGWRKIPGNECKDPSKGGKDAEIEHSCKEGSKAPSGKIVMEDTAFPTDDFAEYYYLEACESCTDETILTLTKEGEPYISHDHGKSWELIPETKGTEILAIFPHQYHSDAVFLVSTKKVFYSYDRGKKFESFDTPLPPQPRVDVLQFHPNPKNKDWLIWTGYDGKRIASMVTSKRGYEWNKLLPDVGKCQFMWDKETRDVDERQIYCEYSSGDMEGRKQLVASDNYFEDKKVIFEDLVRFATMSEFIVIASKTEDRKWLKLDASVDGKTFADAKFPSNFEVTHQTAYTVLDSSTHSVFLHVTVNAEMNREYGSIVKSNSNGTSYVLSVNEVNRNSAGYVDFEKMLGIEGVALVNVVANKKDVEGGGNKKLKTMITHNDGADWNYLQAPEKDVDNKPVGCEVFNKPKCALHIHGFTERTDPRNTFSSPTAVGLMLGIGNVGEYLGPMNEGNTFLTRDGGITWKEVKKGAYFWEFGDQGSLIMIVKRLEETSTVLYSLDEGDTWTEYEMDLKGKKMKVEDLTTVPSDTSLRFLLWGKVGGKPHTVHLDFEGLFDRECKLDDNDPTAGDYELWSPKHPNQDNDCLFGHVSRYHRKKQGTLCKNPRRIDREHSRPENCKCTRQDYECDYNYERASDQSCQLAQGLEPVDPMGVCKNKDVFEYHITTGYRRIPLTTCEEGRQFDGETLPCPGHEEEYEAKHGTSGFVVFLAIVIPIAAAAGVGYWVWKNWSGKFGQIRLGDGYGGGAYSALDGNAPWIRWPVAAISGVVAVLAAIPLLFSSLWNSSRGRFGGGYGGRTYNSRSSFARGRGDYAVVDPDEGELLGDDSDEEV